DLVARAHERLETPALPLLLVAVQHVQAALLLGLRNVVGEPDRRGAGPRRVAEGEEPVETHLLDERERRVELAGGLAGIADDYVARQRERGDVLAQHRDL